MKKSINVKNGVDGRWMALAPVSKLKHAVAGALRLLVGIYPALNNIK